MSKNGASRWRLRAATLVIGMTAVITSEAVPFRGRVTDADTGELLAARIYLENEAGELFAVEAPEGAGSAIPYTNRNWLNAAPVEMHTTVTGGRFGAEIPPGQYRLIVERGKEYFAATNRFEAIEAPVEIDVQLKRWVNMAARGWFSGDIHVHRSIEDLKNAMLAEDLNVAFPLSYWVTEGMRSPATGDKTSAAAVPERLIELDATHVIWPRNTEWEIFSVNGRRHVLGALFALGHGEAFTEGAPPLRSIAERARRDGILLDLDKPDWPWSMVLPPVAGARLYELANNHVWRSPLGVTQWNSEAPGYLLPPYGGKNGDEREWIRYTLGCYYTLLNSGMTMMPAAGTANGVHPVPLGFGRVYVHLPGGFSYESWVEGLRNGRSFVTTGPMLIAQANDCDPGHLFERVERGGEFVIRGTVQSERPLTFIEVIRNGEAAVTVFPENRRSESGAFESVFESRVTVEGSGWIAVRCWEDRPGGQARFAHTAPWRVEVPGRPLRLRPEEKAFLVKRVEDELTRSREALPAAAIEEYEEALDYYRSRDVWPVDLSNTRPPKSEEDARFWISNMIRHHFTEEEMIAATGMARTALRSAVADAQPVQRNDEGVLEVWPYPGGRHPRIGFLDGAIQPQRETKFSVFAPWDGDEYVVVDLPEAIWSNLGLIYLAHTHVPTVWETQGRELPKLEWQRSRAGSLRMERTLPNGIAFGAEVTPEAGRVRMRLWLRNGTEEKLTGLRVQVCAMLKGARSFSAQTNENKVMEHPRATVRSKDGRRWIRMAWEGCDRVWANAPVPCIHSDPKFPDCAPGEEKVLEGFLEMDDEGL